MKKTKKKGNYLLLERVIALLIDLICSYNLYIFIPDKFLPIGSIINKYLSNPYADVLIFYATFVFFRIISTLIFSVSIGQFLVGIFVRGHFLSTRFLGVFRVVFHALLAPFLFFDIPILVAKRSFVEVISFTKLEKKGPFRTLLGAVFFAPLLLIISVILPFLFHLDYPLEFKVDNARLIMPKEMMVSYGSNMRNFYSNKFGLNAFSSLLDNRFILLNDLTENDGDKKIIIYDRQSKEFGEMFFLNEVDWWSLARNAFNENPLFSFAYPDLAKVFVSFKDTPVDLFVIGKEQKYLKELKTLIMDSFSYGPSHLMQSVFKVGPFHKSFLDFRSNVLSVIPNRSARFLPDGVILEIGNSDFLYLRQLVEIDNREYTRDLFFSLQNMNGFVFSLNFPVSTVGVDDLAKTFIESFFSAAEWRFHLQENFSFPDKEEFSVFSVMDFYSLVQKNERQRIFLKREWKLYLEKVKSLLDPQSDKLAINRIDNLLQKEE